MHKRPSSSQSLMKGRLVIVIVLLALLSGFVFSAARSAGTYYVSTRGSDSNSGSSAAPWSSITHASKVVHGGDTVIVEDGTYNLPAGGSVGGSLAGHWAIGSN